LRVAQNAPVAWGLAKRGGEGASVEELLERVGMGARTNARPKPLSGGEAARASLAVALANAPPLLLADEPTGEVDADNEARILDLLRARAREGGAVVVATHSDRVADAADRVMRLVDGRVVDG